MRGLIALSPAVRRRTRDDKGFTLIEVMVALGLVFAAVTIAVAVVTRSMTYIGFARQRDTANSLADQTMEQLRALPFATVQAGLDNTDLSTTTDTNILKGGSGGCPSGSYCYKVAPSTQQCPSGVPAYGERIPHGANANITPLVPHQATQTVGPTKFTVSSYISYLCDQLTTNTYRVTVIVSWAASQVHGVNSQVTTQSVFYSGGGCISAANHPFAAPCQPFFYSTADIQGASVGISGAIQGITFDSAQDPPASLDLPQFVSNLSVEQVSQTQGVSRTSGVTLDIDGSSPATSGYARDTTGADNDPAQPGQVYQQTSPNPKAGPGSASVSDSGFGNSFTLTSSGGDTYGSTSTTSASASNPCANRSGTNQTDNQPCGNASSLQNGTMTALLRLKPPGGDLGNATLASVAAPATQSYGFTKRNVASQPTTCTGTAGDGCVHADAIRYLGTFTVGGLPSSIPLRKRAIASAGQA